MMVRLFVLCSLLCGLTSCSALNKKFGLSDDNFIEEYSEDQIKEKTGLDLDLTPGTPEAPKK